MAEKHRNQYLPDSVSFPGETLQEVLESYGMSQAELSDRSGRPRKTINEIIRGKTAITAETAIQFERVLGISAAFWTAREQNYRVALARAKEAFVLESQANWLKQIPYRAMVRLRWVPAHREKQLQFEELLRFFAVASPTSWDGMWTSTSPAFRRSPSFQGAPGSIAAWLRKGELEAALQKCGDFDERAFKLALHRVRSLTYALPDDFALVVKNICAPTGVAVVFVPELPGTRVWGATRWLSSTRALIQLSLRYKTDDHLWFTFFHEAGHILLHGKRDVFLEDEQAERSAKEEEADAFAQDWLIPSLQYRVFCRKGSFSCAAVSRFAREISVAPGSVVGRLQHDGYLGRAYCNDLKRKIIWSADQD
jgi:addiction module HigA family antidote